MFFILSNYRLKTNLKYFISASVSKPSEYSENSWHLSHNSREKPVCLSISIPYSFSFSDRTSGAKKEGILGGPRGKL